MYLCRYFNLPEVANYWEQVIVMNDYQKYRFAKNIITTLVNTVNGKKIALLGWDCKKDTNDTRESAAIYVAEYLIEDGAEIHVYDPKVSQAKVRADLSYLWELKGLTAEKIKQKQAQVFVYEDPKQAMNKSHAIEICSNSSFKWLLSA